MINDQIFTFTDENGVTVFPIAIRGYRPTKGFFFQQYLKIA